MKKKHFYQLRLAEIPAKFEGNDGEMINTRQHHFRLNLIISYGNPATIFKLSFKHYPPNNPLIYLPLRDWLQQHSQTRGESSWVCPGILLQVGCVQHTSKQRCPADLWITSLESFSAALLCPPELYNMLRIVVPPEAFHCVLVSTIWPKTVLLGWKTMVEIGDLTKAKGWYWLKTAEGHSIDGLEIWGS